MYEKNGVISKEYYQNKNQREQYASSHSKIVYYYLAVISVFLVFLKVLASDFFKDIVNFSITFLPFGIIFFLSLYSFYLYQKHPHEKHNITRHTLVTMLEMMVITLIFYILYSPKSFAPVLESFSTFQRKVEIATYFLVLSYTAILAVFFILSFFLYRLYQKSQGKYWGSINLLLKRSLYATFFILLFLLSSSVLAYPHAYRPITDLVSDSVYTLTYGKVNLGDLDMTNSRRITSLKRLTDSLGATYSNLVENVSETNTQLATNIAETKEKLDSSIIRTNKDLKNTLTNDITDRLDTSGGTVEGKLTVEKTLTVKSLSNLQDVIPQTDDTYDLGSVSKGWDNVYVHRLIGSSIITVGDGSTSHSLTATDDLLVSGNLEVNNLVYLDAGADLNSQKIINLADPTSAQDAASKAYVDGLIPTFSSSLSQSGSVVTLLNDSATPGASKYYGTDAAGTLGFHNLPSGGTTDHASLVTNLAYATSGHTGFEPTLTKGNLTEATSSVLTITGGTGAVIGSGTSIQVKLANAGTSGYLSSADWSTFNGKEGALSAGTDSQYYRGDKSWQTLNKSAVGLSNVENTALSTWASTWAGTSNITTLGTITSGTWTGTTIAVAKGGTGTTTGAITGTGNITFSGGSSANNDITIQGTTNATRATSYTFLEPSAGRVIVGSTTVAEPNASLAVYKSEASALWGTPSAVRSDYYITNEMGDTAWPIGIASYIYFNTSGTQGNVYSVVGEVKNSSSGIITSAYGFYGRNSNTSSGSITSSYAFYAEAPTISAGSIGESYGLRIANQGNASVTTAYGLRINAQTGAGTNYSAIFAGTANVGIGTITPTAQLHLGGSAGEVTLEINSNETTAGNNVLMIRSDVASGNDAIFRVQANGAVFADGAYTGTGADYAEFFYTKDTDLKPGEAVCVDTQKENAVKRCQNSGDNNVMGIVSANPSVVGNNADGREQDKNYKIIGMLGQVKGYVTSENGKIAIGDSLTSAEKPGYMRKANAGESTVGVALQNFDKSSGEIQILISRKNKSLTVEKVEEEVTKNIAEMNVQDQVNQMVADAQTQLDNLIANKFSDYEIKFGNTDSSLTALGDNLDSLQNQVSNLETTLQSQIDELKQLTSQDLNLAQINLNTANTELNTQNIDLIKQILGITDETEGNISILGSLTAEKVVVDGIETGAITIVVNDEDKKTIGTATIEAGELETTILTEAVSASSKIFATPLIENPVLWSISKKKTGESFTITLDSANEDDVDFDWWIVDVE